MQDEMILHVQEDGKQPDVSFCSQCGGHLHCEIVKADESLRPVCQTCRHVVFLDPKVAVGVIVHGQQGILLVRRGIHPGYGK